MTYHYDLLIVGGGVIASSIAYNLLNDGYTGKIAVFEKDRTYAYSSTPRSAGGIRQLFGTEINIRLSTYSLEKFKTFEHDMEIDGEPARIDFRQRGYLFLANKTTWPEFLSRIEMQRALGVQLQVLTPSETRDVVPELRIDDLAGAIFNFDAGYMDPYSVMQWYAKKARQLGAEFIFEAVKEISTDGIGSVTGVKLVSGETYRAPIVINACGAWSGEISKTIGLEIPVVPLRRQIFCLDVAVPFEKPLPLTVDPTGVYFRHEGEKIITGLANDVPCGFEFHWEESLFRETIWPILSDRCANFESLKLERGWAGLYDHNFIDHNGIVGQHPELNGYFVATGFSGHGLQQAPAVGKGMSELLRLGRYETIELSPLSIERFAQNKLIYESAVF